MESPILEIYFSHCRCRRTHTAWTEYNKENGALHEATKSLHRVSTETNYIHQEQHNQARCNPMEMESTTRQGASGPAAEIQCSRPADYTQTPTVQGYVNARHINNKISVSVSEGLSFAVTAE